MYHTTSGEYTHQKITRHQAIVRLHDALLIDGDFNGNDSDIKKGNIRLKTGMHPIRILIKKEENEDWNFKIVAGEAGGGLSPLPENVFFHFNDDCIKSMISLF